MSADRRFMLLLACVLALLVALPLAAECGLSGEDVVAASQEERPDGARDADRLVRATTSLEPPPVLQSLRTVKLAERFPRMAQALLPTPSVLANSQIVSYYGNPYTAQMGILGTADPKSIAAQLERLTERYDELNGPIDAVPAIHLVYGVAQYHPTQNGLYLQYVDDAVVRRYLDLTEERGMLLFLDLQIGRSSVEAELKKVLPYLRYPQVHLAIDPEFAVDSAGVPGQDLGSLRAADIDRAQAMLQELVSSEHLPPKVLIVHQFADSMVLDGEAIQRYPDVALVIDMDGFGPAEVKRVRYQRYATRSYASYAAIKLFYEHDPDLMSVKEVLYLEPRPAIVIYQ